MDRNINNERMSAFIETITEQIRGSLHDRSDDMLKAWHENIEEAHEAEKDFPPLKLTMSAAVDIEASRIETTVSFTAKYQTKISNPMPDPNQPELPMGKSSDREPGKAED